MYLDGYVHHDESLHGLGFKKFLKKVKKVASPKAKLKLLKPESFSKKKVTLKTHAKDALKVAKPVAHVAAAWFTGGASLAASAALIARQKQKKAAEQAAREAVATDVAPVEPVTMVAPTADAVQQSEPVPTFTRQIVTPRREAPTALQRTFMPPRPDDAAWNQPIDSLSPEGGDTSTNARPSTSPTWIMPALGLGIGAIVIALTLRKNGAASWT